MKISRGRILIAAGVLMVAAAGALAAYNYITDKRYQERADGVMEQIRAYMEDTSEDDASDDESEDASWVDDDPETTVTIDGIDWIGTLTIPDVDIDLPVTAEYAYDYMTTGLCRYKGSVKTGDMVICGHNNRSYLSPIHKVEEGALVYFLAVSGKTYEYRVDYIDTVDGYDVDGLLAGDDTWDLSVFTCTYGGASRVVLRCVRTDG